MATKTGSEDFVSQAVFLVTETAANTLTFEKLETGLSVYDKIGWVVCRVEFKIRATVPALFNGTGDYLEMALTITNSITTLADDNPAVLVKKLLLRTDFGTAANAGINDTTYIYDYSNLPGGGLLTLPNPLYFGLVGTGLTGAATVTCRLFFKAIQLNDQDYFNLVQSRQLLIST